MPRDGSEGLMAADTHPCMMVATALAAHNQVQNEANVAELSTWYKSYCERRGLAFRSLDEFVARMEKVKCCEPCLALSWAVAK